IEQYHEIGTGIPLPLHIILVNDGSTTGVTESDIKMLRSAIPLFNYIEYIDNKGKGFALRKGVAAADTEIIIYTDIDFPYSVASISELFNTIHTGGYDIAIGIKNDLYYANVPP